MQKISGYIWKNEPVLRGNRTRTRQQQSITTMDLHQMPHKIVGKLNPIAIVILADGEHYNLTDQMRWALKYNTNYTAAGDHMSES